MRFRNEILSEPEARRTLVAGIDRQEVVDTIYIDHHRLATSFLSTTAGGHVDRSAHLEYDPDHAEELLDVTIQAWILDLLEDLQEELGPTHLFISHDLAVVRRLSHTLSVMREGRVGESGLTEEIFAAPRHTCTRGLIEAVPGRREPVPLTLP
ncbi:ABC transporter ATP-binding protein [Nocardiopsis sp. MG754419]|nr:ABC transporter ATP-binding protein [Nocardiopsis sp. MG754419]